MIPIIGSSTGLTSSLSGVTLYFSANDRDQRSNHTAGVTDATNRLMIFPLTQLDNATHFRSALHLSTQWETFSNRR